MFKKIVISILLTLLGMTLMGGCLSEPQVYDPAEEIEGLPLLAGNPTQEPDDWNVRVEHELLRCTASECNWFTLNTGSKALIHQGEYSVEVGVTNAWVVFCEGDSCIGVPRVRGYFRTDEFLFLTRHGTTRILWDNLPPRE